MVSISKMFSKEWFRRDVIVIIAFLVLQFILGMSLNLFVAFPSIPAGSTDQAYLNAIVTTPFLLEHFMVGVGLLLGSIWILASALKLRRKGLSAIAAVGFISILTAYVSGFEFLLSGFQNDALSFVMSLGFIVALVSYFRLYQLGTKLKG
ncbi:MAG: hypothetical protein KGH94_04185 [Candidatus Micrarchaeota archaeon]|nr:hypothetical protein [Candidatus Micrarchaeota archaeon]